MQNFWEIKLSLNLVKLQVWKCFYNSFQFHKRHFILISLDYFSGPSYLNIIGLRRTSFSAFEHNGLKCITSGKKIDKVVLSTSCANINFKDTWNNFSFFFCWKLFLKGLQL